MCTLHTTTISGSSDLRGYGGGSALVPVGFTPAVALGGTFDAAIAGRWSDPFVVPVVGVSATLLHTGKVLFWSYDPVDHHNPANSKNGVAYLWTGAHGPATTLRHPRISGAVGRRS